MLERAVRGIAPAADVPAADKRLAKALAKRAGKPLPRQRRATRPAGPPTQPTERPAEPAESAPNASVGPAKPQSGLRHCAQRSQSLRSHRSAP